MSTANRRFQKSLLAAACAAASAAAMQPALAQSGTPAIEEIQVISTSRRPESLSDVNASIAVLSEEELRLISHTHIQEAANRLPGVNINRNNGQESRLPAGGTGYPAARSRLLQCKRAVRLPL